MATEPTPLSPAAQPRSNLTQDVQITGTLTFKGELTFDGTLKGGNIHGRKLILGENADVEGNVSASEVTLSGRVKGNATVAERCHLKASARLNGDLTTSRLIMEEGATFIGQSRISPRGKGEETSPPAPKSA